MISRCPKVLQTIICSLLFISVCYCQDSTSYDLTYEMNMTNPNVVITPEEFKDTKKYADLDIHFKSEWIEEFISADITIMKNGKAQILKAQDHHITEDIKMAMAQADSGQKINVSFKFVPKNALKEKNVKEDGFSFTILPHHNASFPGGVVSMDKYFHKVINQVTPDDIVIYNLAAIRFTINENGDIINPEVVTQSKHKHVDTLLLNAICDMPSWKPASYNDGTTVSQDYVFTVGDHSSCTINTLDLKTYTFHK